jgi:hypothetical protein
MMFSAKAIKLVSVWAMAAACCALAGASEPIGYLQMDGPVTIQPDGSAASLTVTENHYTIFSNDRISAGDSSAVLILNGGGVIGIDASSSIRVRSLEGAIASQNVMLETGTILYSFPERSGLRLKHGRFTVRPALRSAQRVEVDRAVGEFAGMVEALDGGHIRVSVKSGDMDVLVGSGRRHVVASGQSTGLLSSPLQMAQAPAAVEGQSLALIEAPEQVVSGESFTVRWSGEALGENSYITVAPAGSEPEAFESVASTTQGNTLEFQAPGEPGDYEIRFVDGETGEISGFTYLQVSGPSVAAPWYTSNAALTGSIAFVGAAGATALALDDDDEEPQSISP